LIPLNKIGYKLNLYAIYQETENQEAFYSVVQISPSQSTLINLSEKFYYYVKLVIAF